MGLDEAQISKQLLPARFVPRGFVFGLLLLSNQCAKGIALPGPLLEFLMSFLTPERLARMEEVLAQRTRHVTVVLEQVHRTQNASACLRNCEAFGIQDVHIVPNAAGFKVNRDIAQGSASWLSLHIHKSPGEYPITGCFDWLKTRGYKIIAVSGRGASGLLTDYDPASKTALLFGNEQEGLSETALQGADDIRALPMFGFTESFNLSVAVALALGELVPRVRTADIPWQLGEAEKQELREIWVRRSLGHRARRYEREFARRFPQPTP
jgi:tRNA (guanosine-2'-O-)-methyltransferase